MACSFTRWLHQIRLLDDRARRCFERRYKYHLDYEAAGERVHSQWQRTQSLHRPLQGTTNSTFKKWWSSGAGDPRCKIYIVMGKSDPSNKDAYKQQSVILVPAGTLGVTVQRVLSVYGYDDAPHGHAQIKFENVRVPASSIVLGEGRGFEIIQGRLGPGRIHHAMRSIGAAERALEWMIARVNDTRKTTFGKPLSEHGVLLEWIAKSRLEIDAARLIVLNTAIKIDESDAKGALKEIAEAKVMVPQMALTVIDRAVQSFGGAGVCQDTPLANMWAQIRTLRIADGPDEVHLQQMGKNENKRHRDIVEKLKVQRERGNSC